MPNHMAELGTGNFDQELTLNLLGSEETPSTRSRRQSNGSKTELMAGVRPAVEKSPRPAWMPSLIRPAFGVVGRKKVVLDHADLA